MGNYIQIHSCARCQSTDLHEEGNSVKCLQCGYERRFVDRPIGVSFPFVRLCDEGEPLPQTFAEFIQEIRMLVHSIRETDSLIAHGFSPIPKHELIQVLWLQTDRVSGAFPAFRNCLPPFNSSPEFNGVVGQTYCEVALNLGKQFQKALIQFVPYDIELELRNESIWTASRLVADHVSNALDIVRSRWKPVAGDFQTLLDRINIEAGLATPLDKKPEPPKPMTEVTIGADQCHVRICETTYILKGYDEARYLKALIERADWMSTSEYSKLSGEENSRPDRLRAKLPAEVQRHIETDRRKGSRWHDTPLT